MPEGDTLFRTAAALRPHLVGRPVTGVRARLPGPRVERLVGATVTEVAALGKNLLVRFDSGLELRTHLRMHGAWHRYAPGERWRRTPGRAVLVLEVPGAVAVCFDAPVVELLETRAERLHPPLAALGPDLCADRFDAGEAHRRLRDPARAGLTTAEALLDQRALAGIGNVYKSEICFIERVDPFARVGDLDDAALGRLVGRARTLLLANRGSGSRVTTRAGGGRLAVGSGPVGAGDQPAAPPRTGRLWVYGRAGRPCRRCGSRILAHRHGELARTTYWCPRCQGAGSPAAPRRGGPGITVLSSAGEDRDA